MTHILGHLEQSQAQKAATFAATGTAITGETLTDTTIPDLVPEPVVPDSDISGISTDLPDVETPFSDKATDFISDFLRTQEDLAGKSAFEAGVREDVGISGLRTQQEDLTAQIEGFKRQSLALQNQRLLAGERIQQESTGRGRTAGGVAPLTASAQRKLTLQQADIASQALTTSALLSAVQGRIGTAQRLVQEAVDKKFGAALAEKEAIIENLNVLSASGVLTREENKRLEAQKTKQEAEKTKIEDEKTEQKAIWDIGVTYADEARKADVFDAATAAKINNAETKEEALTLMSEALGGVVPKLTKKEELQETLIEEQIETQNVNQANTRAKTAEILAETAFYSDDEATEFSDVAFSAANLMSIKKVTPTRIAITKALSKGNYPLAYSNIANAVESFLTGEVKTKFAFQRNDILAVQGMRDAVLRYTEAGGDLGFLKGKTADIIQGFGQLADSDDPEFAALGVMLDREFQAYRTQVTGAAFSPEESADYRKVNPHTDATLDLNLAIFDGVLSQLENRITSTVETRVPGSTAIWKLANGDTQADIDPEKAEEGTFFEWGGVRFQKIGTDEYVEVNQ